MTGWDAIPSEGQEVIPTERSTGEEWNGPMGDGLSTATQEGGTHVPDPAGAAAH